jgi:FkbM family methyltransferase
MFGGRRRRRVDLLFSKLDAVMPLAEFRVVLDVGANVGAMTGGYLDHFPQSRVWAFEPIAATCARLRARFAGHPRVMVVQAALGAESGRALMRVTRDSVGCWIEEGAALDNDHESVALETGDAFLADAGLSHVDFLKIDTEGHDLKVLHGFAGALRRKAIRFLQVEAGMNATNRRHVPLHEFQQFLEPLGYHIFRIFHQSPELGGRRILRRADVVFCHEG